MTVSNELEHRLEQLVKRELATGSSSDILACGRLVSDRLIRQLTSLIGAEGARALHERSLVLTKRQHPWFDTSPAQAQSNAQVQADPGRALQASVAWLGFFVTLLATFIGEGLTLRVLHEIWPDVFLLGSKKEST